jgi:hypothetical protein
MSTVTALPSTLREKLAAAARRVRLLRAVRGASLCTLIMLVTGGTALAADAWLDLPAQVRGAFLAGWLGLGAGTMFFGLLLPLCRRLDVDALAALVEEKYPDLGERLTSSVELADEGASAHGSPALIALLLRETETRTHPLNFLQAVPVRQVAVLAVTAGLVLIVPVIFAIVAPGRMATLAERFFAPWHTEPTPVLYTLKVTPGDEVAARGRPLILQARVEMLVDGAAKPRSGVVVITDADGSDARLPLMADGEKFTHKIDSVAGDFRYRVEVGAAVSDTFQITAVEPINIAAGGPTLTVTPPKYARNTIKTETITGFQDVSALQHSRVRLEVHFTQPAQEAWLHWPAGKGEAARVHALELSTKTNRTTGAIELPALADGPYKLVLKGENGFTTEIAGRDLTARVDQPPAVLKLGGINPGQAAWKVEADPTGSRFEPVKDGSEALKAVLPYDTIPLEVSLADDVGVDLAQVEFRVNGGPVQHEDMTLIGRGATEASARHLFRLSGKVKEGDEVRFRIKVADNRDVPEAKLTPQVVYYPADRWLGLKIAIRAEPLAQQEILAQRDDINKRLEAIKEALKSEQRGVYNVRQESRDQPSLLPEQAQKLQEQRRDNADSQRQLLELAREAAQAPNLQALADIARDVAEEELRHTGKQLQEAEKATKAQTRERNLREADKELDNALRKLDALTRANDRLAKERLDQKKLEMVTERQKELARRAAELAAKDPVKDKSARPQAAELQREQKEVADELQRLADQSEALRDALDAARAEQAKELAERARELAQAERDLAQAQNDTEKSQRDKQFSELARKQRALADKAAQLAKETKLPTQAAQTRALKPDDTKKAAEDLQRGDIGEALKHQDQSANELQRLAGDLDRAIQQARDPKEAARQLARLQKDLQKRLEEETRKPNAKTPLAERLKPLEREQKAIQEAAEDLSVPPQNQAAQQDRKEAADRAAKAAEALRKSDKNQAAAKMEQARQALDRLADRLPTLQQRQQQARAELEQLRRQQDDIARQAEQAVKQMEKRDPNDAKTRAELAQKLTDNARRQAETAERLSKMDAPKQAARQERAQEALNKALKDLLDGSPRDLAASQKEARKQLERLQDALAGKKVAEESAQHTTAKPNEQSPRQQASNLAKQQRDLAKATQQAKQQADKKPGEQGKQELRKAMKDIADKQQQLNRQASKLPANTAQRALQEARTAQNKAQDALGKEDATRAERKQNDAAAALERLAQQLPERAPASAKKDQADPPQGLPSKPQAERARQLAKEQRELRDAVGRMAREAAQARATPKEDPLADLAKQQRAVAKEAAQLAKDVGEQQGQKSTCCGQAGRAAKSVQRASKQVQAGSMQRAQQAGKQAAQQLQKLANDLGNTPQGQASPKGPNLARQSEQLAQRQQELNRRMEAAARDADAQRAHQQAQQDNLRQQAGRLGEELNRLAQQSPRSPQGRQEAQQASASSQRAASAMQQAQSQGKQGNQGQAQQSQQQAAQALDQAAQQASQAAHQMEMARTGPQPSQQTGKALQQAQGQMSQAQGQLAKGKARGAQSSMQRAAQALQQVAQQMGQNRGQPKKGGEPNQIGAAPGGKPEETPIDANLKKYAGKRWGELPGALQTKILQDMKAKYGDDGARLIKLYFEQMADMKK